MKHLKTIFIMIITLNISTICSEQTEATDTTTDTQELIQSLESDENKAKTAEIASEENELLDWENHLGTLNVKGQNWVAANNVPTDDWTTQAFTIANKAMTANSTLSEELKSSFSDAIKEKITQEGGSLTVSPEILIEKFDRTIEGLKKPASSEPTVEKKEEQKTDVDVDAEKIAVPEPQIEQIEPEATTTPTEESTTTESASPAESEAAELPKEEKKKNLINEWKDCLQSISNEYGAIDSLVSKARELGQKLNESKQKSPEFIVKEFSKAFATYARRNGLSHVDKDSAINDFARIFNIYMPTPSMPSSQMQPTASDIAVDTQQESSAEIQRKLMEEQRQQQAQREKQQTEMNLKLQSALIKSGKANEQIMLQLKKDREESRAAAQELLQSSLVAQKKPVDEGLFARAKKTVTELIWGPTQTAQPVGLSTKDKEELLEKMVASHTDDSIKLAIKKAYQDLNRALSAFKPTQEWQDIVEKSLLTLIRYKIIIVDDAMKLLTQSLDSYRNVDDSTKITLKKRIRAALNNEAATIQLQEEKQAAEETRKKVAQEKRTEGIKARINQEFTQREKVRMSELSKVEAEKMKAAAIKDFNEQMQDWNDFTHNISTMRPIQGKNITTASIDNITTQAITKAKSLLTLASRIPSENINRVEEDLKSKFIKALLTQQQSNSNDLKIYDKQNEFDKKINSFLAGK